MELKSPKTYEEQLAIIKAHGCVVNNDFWALEHLKNINYYRLSAYFLPFKTLEKQLNVSFERIVKIYDFDCRLRSLLISILEKIEISFKARISYYLAHKYGALAYENPQNFIPSHRHENFIEIFRKEIKNNAKHPVVVHHNCVYGGKFPIWVAVEFFTFGFVSKFYGDFWGEDKKAISRELYSTSPKELISYLRCCVDLRNICAHYGRIYFRVFPAIPLLKSVPENKKRTFWSQLLAAKALYPEPENWNRNVVCEIKNLLSDYKEEINLEHLGFPANWEEIL